MNVELGLGGEWTVGYKFYTTQCHQRKKMAWKAGWEDSALKTSDI